MIIGTRGSRLAVAQADSIKNALLEKYPDLKVNIKIIKTKGDKILDVPLAMVGGKGLFVKEIEEALLTGAIDLAVHSMKDVPAEIPQGLEVGIVTKREDPRDCIVFKDCDSFESLPEGASIGTSSLRRRAQLLRLRPDIDISPLRGNLDTRLEKLNRGLYDAIIVAAAGLSRLSLSPLKKQFLDTSLFVPAVGQGALGLEYRRDDKIGDIVRFLDHLETKMAVTAERAFLRRLEGGCQVPIAGFASVVDRKIIFRGLVGDENGREIVSHMESAPLGDAEKLGDELALKLLNMGAKKILDMFYAG